MRAAATPFGLVAAAALVFMMLVTTVSVGARQTVGRELFGLVDMMELALTVCIYAALPGVFLRDENITVDLVDGLVPPRVQLALRLFALLLAFAFLSVAASQMIAPALDKLRAGETTMTLNLPRWLHWLPILAGFGAGALATAWAGARLWRRGLPAPRGAAHAPGH
jgi:TRAP-type C4-dicarboxylate transport system permease small subunit